MKRTQDLMEAAFSRSKRSRRFFSFLEILIVMIILFAVAGIFGVTITKAVRDQRFRAEVDLVVDQLRLAQDLMLIFRGDVHLKISPTPEKNGLQYRLVFEHPLPAHWKEELQRSHSVLKTIHAINFHTFDEDQTIDLKFLSGGAEMSKGVLRLATSNAYMLGTLERFVCLPGIPAPIVSVSTRPDEKSCEKLHSDDDSITQRTVEEIRGFQQ